MDIKPIKTKKDYDAALKEIDKLFSASPGTPEGDRLEVLVMLVDAYEEKHHKILPPDPIEAINYYMESRGLTRSSLEHLQAGVRIVSPAYRRIFPSSKNVASHQLGIYNNGVRSDQPKGVTSWLKLPHAALG